VKLLPRRTAAPAEIPAEVDPAAADRKGRPTPKRRDQVVARGPITPPKTRKEAYARQKEQTKAARAARKTPASAMTVQQRRLAMKAGDPSVLPRRDQGPTRKLARDYVDSHRMISNYLLGVFVLLLISVVFPPVQILVLAVALTVIVEWYLVGRRIRNLAIARNGSAQGGPMTIGFYAGSRAYLPRRWRLPRSQVSLGDEI
jgi:hypothetical protein